MAAKTGRRRVGRPPAGARDGEKVKDYPQLALRIPSDVKARLQALSVVTGQPQWRLLIQAIECYVKERPEAEQRLVDALLARSKHHPSRQSPSRPG